MKTMTNRDVNCRNKPYSIGEYIIRLFVVFLFMFVCFVVFANDKTPAQSLIWSSVAFLIITIFSTIILLRDTKWVLFFIIAYSIKLAIGIVHYLYFIDPTYFSTNGMRMIQYDELQTVYSYFCSFVDSKHENGIFSMQLNTGLGHEELWNIIAIPFVYFGPYLLTISPLQSFLGNFFAVNMLIVSINMQNHTTFKVFREQKDSITKNILIRKFSSEKLKFFAIFFAYFPLFLITSRFWRDLSGITLISIGITLLVLSRKSIYNWLMLIVSGYLFYLHRTPYLIAIVMAFALDYLIHQRSSSVNKEIIVKLFLIVIIITLMPFVISLSYTDVNELYLKEGINVSPLLIPIKFIIGLIGPFPWTQFLTRPELSYQLAEYIMGTINIVILVEIVKKYKVLFRVSQLNIVSISGLLLFFIGFMNKHMYITYVSVATPFLFIWISKYVSPKQFGINFLYVFVSLVLLNSILFLVGGQLGISTLWK